jgi:hypothetical protein
MHIWEDLYDKLEHWLTPMQWLVSIGLMAIIGMTTYLLFSPNAVERTAWVVYMFMP